jgi:hypothetical protein
MRGARRVAPLSWECRIGMPGVGLWNRIGVTHARNGGMGISHRRARCPDRESRMDVPNARTGIMRTHDASSCPSHGNIASSPTGTSHHRPWEYHPQAHRIGMPDIRPGIMESHPLAPCAGRGRGIASMGAMPGMGIMRRTRRAPAHRRSPMHAMNPEGEAGHEPPAAGCIEALR